MEFLVKAVKQLRRASDSLPLKWCLPILLVTPGAWAQSISLLPHKDVPVGPGCCTVVAGDFDGDDNIDLVVGYGGVNNTGAPLNTKLALFRGDGKGGFEPPRILATFDRGIYRVLASDINRDGKLDLIITDEAEFLLTTPHTYVLLGNGDGTFGSPLMSAITGVALLAADFNGDGIPDVLSEDDRTGCAAVQLGKGDGSFAPVVQCVKPREGVVHNVVAADINGDKKLDVGWTSNRTDSEWLWVGLGNGDGTLQPFYLTDGLVDGGIGGHPLAIADLNDDRKLDLIVSGRRDNVSVSLGNGDGTFQSREVLSLYEGPFDPVNGSIGIWVEGNDIFVTDFDGDGNPDIILDNALLLGNGDGSFQAPRFFTVGVPLATLVFVGDLNHDGKPDLVFINAGDAVPNGTALTVLLNNSPGFANSVPGVSAATGSSLLAPSSIASVYGKNLAKTIATAASSQLPTQLGGISLRVRDKLDVFRLAPLFYVSPSQINFLVPDGTPTGPVTLTIDDGSTPLNESANATIVNDVSPGFFTASGVPSAYGVRVLSNGNVEPVPAYTCTAPDNCALTPIDLSRGPVYLSLFGTGFRFANIFSVQCQVGGIGTQVTYAGPQPTFAGLDQVNILLPAALPHGTATVQCTFGVRANPVQILIQ